MTTPPAVSSNAVLTFIDPAKAAVDTSTKVTDLAVELERQSGLVYYYSSAAAKAERQVSAIKFQLEQVEAVVHIQVRKDAVASGEKLTADDIKARVKNDVRVRTLTAKLLTATEVQNGIKAVVESLRHKRDMLTMLGHISRDEMKVNLGVFSDTQGYRGEQQYIRDREAQTKSRLAQ